MAWRMYPSDYLFCDKRQAEGNEALLKKKCCDVFNEASKQVFDSKTDGVTFSQAFAQEARGGGGGGLWVVSSRFASEFPAVFERFSKVLYSGLARLPPEECLHHAAQFYEAVCRTQSHHGPAENAEHRAKWTERETFANLIERTSSRAVGQSVFLTDGQEKTKKLVSCALSKFCGSIVSALMRVAYAEDRNSQCRFVHYCLFLLRDIIEETLRIDEFEKELNRPMCCLI
jgi:hypothetical protein